VGGFVLERPYGRDECESPAAMLLTAMMPLAARRRVTFSYSAKKNVTKKKAAPEPPTPPALLAPTGREPNSPSAQNAPGSDTGSRNLPAEAAMLGGGYGSRRQQQHLSSKSGI